MVGGDNPYMSTYKRLNTFLRERLADRLVLTFAQIEDILGFPLPAEARLQPGWWTLAPAGAVQSEQADCWSSASRTASANLSARTVLFERT
jgi:hypothetical protein